MKEKLQEIYTNAVENELGLKSRIDGDGDVVFKHPDMGTMYFSVDEDDPQFMRLVFPNFADERLTGSSRDLLVKAINTVNMKNKAVKLYARLDEDGTYNVSAAVECFVASPNNAPTQEHINGIVRRCMSALRAGVENLVREGNKEESNSGGI